MLLSALTDAVSLLLYNFEIAYLTDLKTLAVIALTAADRRPIA
jgi:hypothetical protein